MANRTVSIWKHIKLDGKWRFAAVYQNPKNHKLEANKVVVAGKAIEHAEGVFYLSWYDGDKKVWKKVSDRLKDAEHQADMQQCRMEATFRGMTVVMPDEDSNRIPLESAISDHLEEVRMSRRPGTHELAVCDLNEFLVWSKLDYVDQVDRKTLLRFKEHIIKSGRTARTAANKMMRVNQFLRVVLKTPVGQGPVTMRDAKTTEPLPEVYSNEELEKFFAKCKPHHHLLFTTLLQTGLRKLELVYLYWDDIDFVNGSLRVRQKPEFGFTTKTHEERDIPVPADLLARLKRAKESSKTRLVFPTKSGQPNKKWWYMCRGIARKAGLDVENWWLHKFRGTYATQCLRAGMDIKTVQYLLGHHDIDSTMRYLAPVHGDSLRDKLESVWATKLGPKLVATGTR